MHGVLFPIHHFRNVCLQTRSLYCHLPIITKTYLSRVTLIDEEFEIGVRNTEYGIQYSRRSEFPSAKSPLYNALNHCLPSLGTG